MFFCLIPCFSLKQARNCFCLIFCFLYVSTKKYAAVVKCTDLSLNLLMLKSTLSKPIGSKHETLALYLSSLSAFIFKKKKIYIVYRLFPKDQCCCYKIITVFINPDNMRYCSLSKKQFL